MKRTIIICLLLSVGVSSCGLLKSVTTKHNKGVDKIKVDSSYVTTVTNKSHIVVVEKIDTTIKTKPIRIDVIVPAIVEPDGTVIATLDSLMMRVKVRYNAIKKTVEFGIEKHSELLPIHMDRTTTTQADVKTKSKGNVTKNKKKVTDIKSKQSDPKNIFWVFAGFLLVIIGIYMFLKSKV